ncbi:MAG: FHA domain-containing protein [Proteobacteria bacterium]|nr:FHA domain-containing protein [Pseudomonadota bacterium]
MSDLVLEINDIGLTVSDGEKMLLSSPACALLDGNHIVVGQEAFEKSRLRPLWTNNRFWSRLDQEKLANPSGRFQTNADLAHAHLEHIWHKLNRAADSGLIIVVPGTWDQAQMGLLLGIAADMNIPVSGMVDSAVAAGVSLEPDVPRLHLDLQQGKFVLTELQGGTQLSRSGVFVICETGLSSFRDVWANIIADVFVSQTRFDPMHIARTEQQLFNKLDGWLADIEAQGSAVLEMDAGDKSYTVQLAGDQLLSASSSVYPQIVQQIRPRAKGMLALSHRLADFPGLKDSLALIAGLELRWLDENAAARGALAKSDVFAAQPDTPEVTFLTSLPLSADSSSDNAAVAHDLLPTHLVYRARAYPLDQGSLVLGAEPKSSGRTVTLVGILDGVSRQHCTVKQVNGQTTVEDHSSYGTFVNDRAVNGSADLVLGDVIRMGSPGETAQLIGVNK